MALGIHQPHQTKLTVTRPVRLISWSMKVKCTTLLSLDFIHPERGNSYPVICYRLLPSTCGSFVSHSGIKFSLASLFPCFSSYSFLNHGFEVHPVLDTPVQYTPLKVSASSEHLGDVPKAKSGSRNASQKNSMPATQLQVHLYNGSPRFNQHSRPGPIFLLPPFDSHAKQQFKYKGITS